MGGGWRGSWRCSCLEGGLINVHWISVGKTNCFCIEIYLVKSAIPLLNIYRA